MLSALPSPLTMNSPLETTLKETIQKQLNSFFSALQSGHPAKFASFLSSFSAFSNTIRKAQDKLRPETIIAARNVVSIIDNTSSTILQLANDIEKLHQDATAELAKLSLDDNPQTISPTRRYLSFLLLNISERERFLDKLHHPPYLRPSMDWLLLNLHNPYPSKEVKKTIAQQTGSPLKDIDAWFSDARKRIGWNKLRKTRFSNKQEKIIAAACHIFKPKSSSFTDNPDGFLPTEMNPNDAYRGEFLIMQQKARTMYANKFPDAASHRLLLSASPSGDISVQNISKDAYDDDLPHYHANTENLDSSSLSPYPSSDVQSVDDHTPSTPPNLAIDSFSKFHNLRRSFSDIIVSGETYAPDDKHTSFPSPSGSDDLPPDVSDEHIPAHENITTVSGFAEPSVLKKRTRQESEDDSPRHSKQPRLSLETEHSVTRLPGAGEISSLKRKRRLSDGESAPHPKRPHNALCVPRIHAVSDPFPALKSPVESNIDLSFDDGLFDHEFSDIIPPPAHLEDPCKSNIPLEVFDGQYCNQIFPQIYVPGEEFTDLITGDINDSVSNWKSKLLPGFVDPPYFLNSPDSILDAALCTGNPHPFDDLTNAPTYDPFSTYVPFSTDTPGSVATLGRVACSLSPSLLTSEYSIESECVSAHETTSRSLSHSMSSDAKRAKIQALNEQIRLLEAEL